MIGGRNGGLRVENETLNEKNWWLNKLFMAAKFGYAISNINCVLRSPAANRANQIKRF